MGQVNDGGFQHIKAQQQITDDVNSQCDRADGQPQGGGEEDLQQLARNKENGAGNDFREGIFLLFLRTCHFFTAHRLQLGLRFDFRADGLHLGEQCVRILCPDTELFGGKGKSRLFHLGKFVDLTLHLGGAVGAVQPRHPIDLAHYSGRVDHRLMVVFFAVMVFVAAAIVIIVILAAAVAVVAVMVLV